MRMRVRDDYEKRGHTFILSHGARRVLTRKCAVARSRKCTLCTSNKRVRINRENPPLRMTVVHFQTISEKSLMCTAAKEDKHQNVMSNVALKKRIEESWTIN